MARNKFLSNLLSLNFLKTFTNFLMGFLAGLIILLAGLKIISSIWGALLGLAISFSIAYFLLKKYRTNKILKDLGIGLLTSAILLVLVYLGISILFWSMFRGIAG